MRRYVAGLVGVGVLIALAIWWFGSSSSPGDVAPADARASTQAFAKRSALADGRIVVAQQVKCEATTHGVVTDLIGGGPIEGVEISFVIVDDATLLATTRDDGHYELCVPRGYAQLKFSGEGFADRTDSVYVEADTTHDVALAPEAIVAGQVIAADTRQPIGHAAVGILVDRGTRDIARGTTDDNGNFEIRRLPSGHFNAFATKDSLGIAELVTGAARIGERTELDRPIELVPSGYGGAAEPIAHAASLSGRVTRNGVPIARAQVTAGRSSGVSAADGSYTITNIKPGNYDLYAEVADVAFTKNHPVELEPDERRTYDLELDLAGTIVGVVIDQHDAPVVGAHISFSLAGARDYGNTATHRDGSFSASGLSGGGSYYLQISDADNEPLPPASGARFSPIRVADGLATVDAGKLRVHVEHQTISGVVLDETGRGLADVPVFATAEGAGLGVSTTTNAAGAFALAGLQRRKYSVGAHAPAGLVEQSADVGTTNLVLKVPPLGAIAIHLDGFEKVKLEIFGDSEHRNQIVERDVTIRGLFPGRYTLAYGTPTNRQLVEVASGETTQITLRPVARGTVIVRVTLRGDPASDRTTCSLSDTNLPLVGGTARFESVPVGTNRVFCYQEEKMVNQTIEIAANRTSTVDLVLPDSGHHDPGITFEMQFDDVVVKAVTPSGPAAQANIHVGDIVTGCNGAPVEYFFTLNNTLANQATNTLTIERDNKTFDVTITAP